MKVRQWDITLRMEHSIVEIGNVDNCSNKNWDNIILGTLTINGSSTVKVEMWERMGIVKRDEAEANGLRFNIYRDVFATTTNVETGELGLKVI